MDFLINHTFRIFIGWLINIYDLQNRGYYRIYGLIIVKSAKKLLVLDYGFSNATFETPNHAFTRKTFYVRLFYVQNFINMFKY
jgi:hypothetical protein